MSRFVGAIDQGTTSTRFLIFDRTGAIRGAAQREHRQIFPKPGWVEHDATEILDATRQVVAEAMLRAGIAARDIAAIGITNQRETTVLWDRRTGAPLHNAIVWQDTRTDPIIAEYARHGGPDRFRAATGLPLASYFSAAKLRWLLETVPDARRKAEAGDALFGTIDSWLAWNLVSRHATDVTNASRTQLFDLTTQTWSPALLDEFGIPPAVLPTIVDSNAILGPITAAQLEGVPLAALLGDQQAALVGQACFAPGEAKNTYGTGSFLLLNTGPAPRASAHGLITTMAYRFADRPACYALEGSIAVTGALIQWLRDGLGLLHSAAESEALAASVPDSGGVTIVPAFSGLYAPWWRADARGLIGGLTRYTTRSHIARAALEAVAFQTRDVLDAMTADSGHATPRLRVDGGMTANDLLLQIQADTLGIDVVRPEVIETTALGAAYAAGLAVGFWPDLETIAANWREQRRFTPALAPNARDSRYAIWREAVTRSFAWP